MWKKLAFLALLAAVVAAVARALRPRPDFAAPSDSGAADWPPLDLPGPNTEAAQPEAAAEPEAAPAGDPGAAGWAEPNPDGSCPDGFPVKVKIASGIYHVAGGLNYERTKADRCYASPAAAAADGFRQSQR